MPNHINVQNFRNLWNGQPGLTPFTEGKVFAYGDKFPLVRGVISRIRPLKDKGSDLTPLMYVTWKNGKQKN